ncbi:anti-phage deoxyguanosine triphosphatase [Ruegeria profundi]|uniref:anti-phage deoxyguanosine triphosphatase n=1 Tax=Ruegeria profundi TaxID=1685378 RepID=UPI001CD4C300|nr:anti-phage deoxyguanosine triphosphatase [Ruegeria profundi]MCA0930178.1 dGTPase [Ruegeria profundi]
MGSYWEDRRDSSSREDHRTPWERDYARVIHSAGCRRLQAKTQVLGMGDGDFYRTRLTHSLEVSQIGVSITKRLYRLAKAAKERGNQTSLDEAALNYLPDPMLMSTICMAHDLGHPPFGHGGEIALNRCMLPYGGFEGNGQTLRIMTKLERYPEGHGMNLTRRAILGVIKYPAPYRDVVDWDIVPAGEPAEPMAELLKNEQPIDAPFKLALPEGSVFVATDFKPPKCYMNEEHDDVVIGWIAKELDDWETISTARKERDPTKHPKTKYKSLDTSIMELADDIAYGVHDLEDAIGLGLIRRKDFVDWFKKKEGNMRISAIQPLLDVFFDGSFDTFQKRLFDEGSGTRKHAIGRMVGFCVEGTQFVESNPNFSEPLFRYQAIFDHDAGVKSALGVLQEVVVDLVIKSTPVQQLEFKGQKMVTELFNAFATDPKRLLDPRDFAQTIQDGGETTTARVICDYIAGMTDEYATRRYQQLFEPRVGSVFDRL